MIDRKTRSDSEILKKQEMTVEAEESKPFENTTLPKKDEKPKATKESNEEVINIENKDDAKRVLEEADGLVESMDSISF